MRKELQLKISLEIAHRDKKAKNFGWLDVIGKWDVSSMEQLEKRAWNLAIDFITLFLQIKDTRKLTIPFIKLKMINLNFVFRRLKIYLGKKTISKYFFG